MNAIERIIGLLATLNSANTEKEPVMSTCLLGSFMLVLALALGAVTITPLQASAQKQAPSPQSLSGDTSGVVSLSWNPHSNNQFSYFVDITGQRVCAITAADGSTADCVSITIPAGAAVTPLNPNDGGIRLFTIGAGAGTMKICAVVGNVSAATTTCTAH